MDGNIAIGLIYLLVGIIAILLGAALFNEEEHRVGSITCLIVATLLLVTSGMLFNEDGAYKRGQVDALSKKSIRCHLVINPDSTKSWEEIPDKK